MKSVGIKELKDHLSSYLESVKNGETIIVLDRNNPVAEIKKLEKSKDLTKRYINESSLNNSIIPAKHHKTLKIPKSILLKGKSKESVSLDWKKLYQAERD